MTFDAADPKTWPVRLITTEVLALARYELGTLRKRIAEGLMPEPVEGKGRRMIFLRDDVLMALKIIPDPSMIPEKDPWDFDDEVFDQLSKKLGRKG